MLDDVGLTSESSRLASLTHSLDFEDTRAATPTSASPVISQAYQPEPQPIHWFTSEECARRDNAVNRQTKIDGIIHHLPNAIVEYPETGVILGRSVGHIFSVNPQEFHHPRLNIQYSQGDIRGGRANATCKFLYNDGTRKEANCKNEKFNCEPEPHLNMSTMN
jgi:hypothetical protein